MENVTVATLTTGQRFVQFAQQPLGSVIVASVMTISTLGFVLSGMWLIGQILA